MFRCVGVSYNNLQLGGKIVIEYLKLECWIQNELSYNLEKKCSKNSFVWELTHGTARSNDTCENTGNVEPINQVAFSSGV